MSNRAWPLSLAAHEGLATARTGRWTSLLLILAVAWMVAAPGVADAVGVTHVIDAEREWIDAGGHVFVVTGARTDTGQNPIPALECEHLSAMDGIGASFAMACDLAVFADNASIYMAFAHIALVPDGGASWQLLHALGRRRAFEVISLGQRLSAEECLKAGLANRIAPAADLLTCAQSWAEELAARSPMATRRAKQILAHAQGARLADTIVFEASFQNACIASNDCKEGMAAFREKRTPVFTGN